jgi:Subtilase family
MRRTKDLDFVFISTNLGARMKTQRVTTFRLKPAAALLVAAVSSTFIFAAHAAESSPLSRDSTAVESLSAAAENRALDENKAKLINAADSPALSVDKPRIDPRLLEMASAGQKAQSKSSSVSVNGGTLSAVTDDVITRGGMVRVELIARGDGQALQTELATAGMKNMRAMGRNISGELPIAAIAGLVASPNLITARAAMRPLKRSGSVLSQGDSAQRSNIARQRFGVNGAGVKIGILSDSYNFLKGEAAGVASGDLPGAGNPNGFTTPVKVLRDFGTADDPGSDEGRAMAEIIHDVAPGAALSFYTAFEGAQEFADGIIALANDGAKIIVDDIGYFNEPWLQDGVIAQAVKTVTQRGVTYFSAAGNSGDASYESLYAPAPGVTKLSRISGEEIGDYELHTFNANGVVSPFQRLTVAGGSVNRVFLQWDEPFASASPKSPGAGSDLDIFFLAREGDFSSVVAFSTFNNLGGDAFDRTGISFNAPAGTTANVYLVIGRPIKRVIGDPVDPRAGKPRFLKTILLGFAGTDASFNRRSTIFSQANAADALSICAVDYAKVNTPTGPVIENFSSLGGTTILLTPEGRRTFEPRFKPDFCAPNRGNTTFFLDGLDLENDGKPNFPGTSASAPHAAAVAALMLQASKNRIGPFFVSNLLRFTTVDMDDPRTTQFDRGFDFRTGFGFINAEAAVQNASYFGRY